MPRYPIDSLIRGVQLEVGEVSAGNYSQIRQNGTLRAFGDASCWRDELQSLVGQRLESPASDIVRNISEGSITFETGARYPTDFVIVNHQLNHDWIPGTIIKPHLHWWQVSANVPNWLVDYRWQKQLDDKTTAWTLLALTVNAGSWTLNPYNQIIASASGITPPVGYGQVSDIVQFRIYRDVTNVSTLFAGADPEAADIDGVNFDSHLQVDQFGSDQEYIKY